MIIICIIVIVIWYRKIC